MAYVWTVTATTTDDATTYSFQNAATGAWIKAYTANGNMTLTTTESEKGEFTLLTTSSTNQFKVDNGSGTRWDGAENETYTAVSWKATDGSTDYGHLIEFFEVTENNSISITTWYPVSATFTQNGNTVATASDVYMPDGTTVFTSDVPVSANSTQYTFELADDATLIHIKNIRQGKYVGANGYFCAGYTYTLNQNDAKGNSTIFLQDGDASSCKLFNFSTLRWVSAPENSNSNTSLVTDKTSATTYAIEVNRTGSNTINDIAYYYTEALLWDGSGSNGWNDLNGSGVCAYSKTDTGSRWYTIPYNDTNETNLTANTADGVVTAFNEAIAEANTVYAGLAAGGLDGAADLKALIDDADAAMIGRTDFTTLTTNLNKKSSELLDANPKAPLYVTILTANGIYIAHDVPGYLPVSTTENQALKTAIDEANKVGENENATYEEISSAKSTLETAIDAMTALIAAQTASQTTIYTTGYYRISNNRGSLYYNSSNPDFIWSTGKNAFTGSEDDDEMLWGFIEKDGNYYLYNVGAKKFAGLGTGSYGVTWTLNEIDPVGIALNSASTGYPNVEILSTDGTHMSMSLNFNGPLISYYKADDGGVPMVFEYVKDADATIAKEMLEKISLEGIVNHYIAKVESFTAGDEIGKFSQTAINDGKSKLEAVKSTDGATRETVEAAYNDFLATFNKPEVGKVYTIESYHSTDQSRRHLYNNEGTLAVSQDADAYGHGNYQYWLFEDNNGTYRFSNTIEDTKIYVAAQSQSGILTIERDPNVYGCVNLYDESTYVMVLNSDSSISRASNPTHSSASGQFYITLAENATSTTVGISEITVGNGAVEQNVIYDLQGRRVMHPTRSGLYIVNGTKKLITL
jgi:hypothetical protein